MAPAGSWLRAGCWLLAVGLLAVWRVGAAAEAAGDSPLAAFRDRPATLRGFLEQAPRCDEASCRFTLRVQTVEAAGAGPTGVDARVQVRTVVREDLAYGRAVEARGELRAPRPVVGFPRVELLARRGVYEVMDFPRLRLGAEVDPVGMARLEGVRLGLERRLVEAVGGAEGQLAAGLLLGREVALGPDLRAALRATGTSHILAVSGYNVAVIGGVVLAGGVRLFQRGWALGLAALAVTFFTFLVGAPPSAIRAALMFGVTALAAFVGRLPDPLTALVVTAGVMTAVDPSLGLDLGFQLSFLATAGLVLVGPRLVPRGSRLLAALSGALGPTLAAQLATLPLVLATFRSVSLVAPLTNVLIAPLLPIVMGLAALALGLAGLPLLGPLSGGTTWLLVHVVVLIITGTAGLPSASIATGSLPPWALATAYALLLIPLVLPWLAGRLGRAAPARWTLAGGLLAAIGLGLIGGLASARAGPEVGLRVRFFDVGGDGLALVETASGRRVLIGAAGSPLAVGAVAEQLPLLDRRIDLLVVTRAGERDLDGLTALLRRYPVVQVVHPPAGGGAGADWAEELSARGLSLAVGTPGLAVDLDGPVLEVDDVQAGNADRPAAMSIQLRADGLDLRVVGARLGAELGEQAVVVRLAPELALSRELRAVLGRAAERSVVIGGRAGPSAEFGPSRFALEGAAIVELTSDGARTIVRRLDCTADTEPCWWTYERL